MYICTHSNYFLILSPFVFVLASISGNWQFTVALFWVFCLYICSDMGDYSFWNLSCYNQNVSYRNLTILIFLSAASNFTAYIFFDWPSLITSYARFLASPPTSPFKLECSLQVVTHLCLWLSKLRKRRTSPLTLTCAKKKKNFLRNILKMYLSKYFSLSFDPLSTDKGVRDSHIVML